MFWPIFSLVRSSFLRFCLAVPGLAALGETGLCSLFPLCRHSLFACAFFVALFFLEEWPMVRPVFPYVLEDHAAPLQNEFERYRCRDSTTTV